ncbi:hypothetical protein N9B85_00575 [bacterium]|nr:hypothetical protein [bacterium]
MYTKLEMLEMIKGTDTYVVLNDDDTYTDIDDCNIVWTNPEQDLDETHPMDCNQASVSIKFLLDYYLKEEHNINREEVA